MPVLLCRPLQPQLQGFAYSLQSQLCTSPDTPTPDPLLCRSLQRKDGSFAPAWQLADGRLERAGRSSKPGHKPVPTPGMTLTAGLVIVGDEILSAKVPDTNTSFLCKELRAIGWRVCKVGWAAVQGGLGCCAA